ncbi:conserved hypothetical protein [Gammaproteobacteria bacterium]
MVTQYSNHRVEDPQAVSPWRMGWVLLLTGLLTASLYPQSLLQQSEQVRWPLVRDLLVEILTPVAESSWGQGTRWWQDWLQVGIRAANGESEKINQGVTVLSMVEKTTEEAPAKMEESREPSREDPPPLASPEPAPAMEAVPPLLMRSSTSQHSPRTLLLVGDSLMQGAAMAIVRQFKKDKDYRVIDISRQSTGLTHPGYFDWPAHIRRYFEKETPQWMVVMMGANDMSDMRSQGRFVRFASERWKALYAERVHELLATATEHAVQVIWMGLPAMRDQALDSAMQLCTLIQEQETQRLGQRYIATRKALSEGDETYVAHLLLEGRKTQVRTNDGVHFTPQGARLVADLLLPALTRDALASRETLHAAH